MASGFLFPQPSSTAFTARPALPRLVRAGLAALLLVLLSLFLTTPTWAQKSANINRRPPGNAKGSAVNYQTGFGLRAGLPTAFSIKHFYKGNTAFEGLVGSRYSSRGIYIGLLVEQHAQAFQTRGLLWYYGLGAHVGTYRGRNFYGYYRKGNKVYYETYDDRLWGIGLDGILGLEYQLKDLPFTIGVDVKPFVELVKANGYFDLDAALSIRYVF